MVYSFFKYVRCRPLAVAVATSAMRSGAIVGAATQSNDRAADAATTRRPYPAAAILARRTVSATKVSEFLKFIGKKIICFKYFNFNQ
jgi:hypothetical protein